MPRKKWIVIIDWIDGDTSDADEFTVFAENAAEAKSKARARWEAMFPSQFPNCRIEKVWILTSAKERLLGI